jgi:iron complex transport system substrate-binding protein
MHPDVDRNAPLGIVSLLPSATEIVCALGAEDERAGGTPVGVEAGRPAPTIPPEALNDLHPDVVIVKPCGFTLERALAERDVIERSIVSALGSDTRVYVTDGNAFFNRPGPRLVESLEILAACIHPPAFADFAGKHVSVIRSLAEPSLAPLVNS